MNGFSLWHSLLYQRAPVRSIRTVVVLKPWGPYFELTDIVKKMSLILGVVIFDIVLVQFLLLTEVVSQLKLRVQQSETFSFKMSYVS